MTRDQIKQKILDSGAIQEKYEDKYDIGYHNGYNTCIHEINLEKLIDIVEEARILGYKNGWDDAVRGAEDLDEYYAIHA